MVAITLASVAPCGLAVRRVAGVRLAGMRPAGLPLAPRPTVARVGKKFVVRAEAETKEGVDVDALVKDLQTKWDAVENKTSVAVYGAGAVVLFWFSSTIVGAVNSVPVLPKALELVGLGYSAWFVYRYLLFRASREELINDVEELKKKITGDK